jgi:hypothetical protein
MIFFAYANDEKELDAQIDALKQTQNLLKDSKARGDALVTPEARATDKAVQNLGNKSGQTDSIYSLSGEVFEKLLKENNGDTEKVQKLLQEGMRNPAQFAEKFSPEQKAKLKQISDSVEGAPGAKAKP